jgi:predicted nucleic acid-binding protein
MVAVTDCRDMADNKYLELAMAARADIIVSSDQDLRDLHPWRGVLILRPADYLALSS